MAKLKKICIICSKGTLDMGYPPLMIGVAAAGMGAEVHLFFTFFGMNLVVKDGAKKLKISPVGRPEMPMPMPNILSVLPGMTPMATMMMKKQIKDSGINSIPELMEMAKEMDVHLHACEPTMAMFNLKEKDLIPEARGHCLGVAGFLELAADADITLFV